jgi:hypothetical protein
MTSYLKPFKAAGSHPPDDISDVIGDEQRAGPIEHHPAGRPKA